MRPYDDVVTQYAELWLRDAGDHRADPAEYRARYDAWLDEFETRKVKSVGFVVRPGPPGKRESPVNRCGTPSGSRYSRATEPGVWPTRWITSSGHSPTRTVSESETVACTTGSAGKRRNQGTSRVR